MRMIRCAERYRDDLGSVNKMLSGMSNVGHGFYVAGSGVSREMWVADFAWSCGWLGDGEICR